MALLPAPASVSKGIADKATQYAREDIRGRGWRSSGSLRPYSAEGKVGIQTTVKYLMHQNRGFGPFIMWWVNNHEGAIPLGCKQGDGPHFRTGGTAGTPGFVEIPHEGKKWRDQRWKHPGLKPKGFMEKGISRAIKESRNDIKQLAMDIVSGKAEL